MTKEAIEEKYRRVEMKNILDVGDMSVYLNVTTRTIYRWVKECGLPYYRRGVRLMFDKKEVDEWQLGKLPEQNKK
jgi:excisionase family DNA binding protein